MDEIIDEFKTGRIVFIRRNHDNYKPSSGARKLRKERLKMLESKILEVCDAEAEHIEVIYMFYDSDNPIIADRWEKTIIN